MLRIREARFPLLKPFETFDFEASPELDTLLTRKLSEGMYIKEGRNVIFLGRSGTGRLIWRLPWGWKRVAWE